MRYLAGIALLTLACTEATPPERAESYSFTVDCSIPSLCSPDADATLRLVFRWPRTALPVRFWVEPTGDLPAKVSRGVEAWVDGTLFGELSARLVSDSSIADVVVRYGPPTEINPVSGIETLDCAAETQTAIDLDTVIVLPMRVLLRPRLGSTDLEVSNCLDVVATHAVGRTLGLLLPSPNPDDVMFFRPTVGTPSPSDIATLSRLYYTDPNVRLPPGR